MTSDVVNLREALVVLVELGLVEQRLHAVTEVLRDGVSVTEVARRYGVTRRTVQIGGHGRSSLSKCHCD